MSGWQWAVLLPAAGLVARGLHVAFTGRKSTNVTWVNGHKYVEHEEPRTGRGMGATLCFAGAAVFAAAATRTPVGSWARSGLRLKDSVESVYTVWAWRLTMPLFVVFISVFVVLITAVVWDSLRDHEWDQALMGALAAAVASAVAGYLAWFWWGLVT